jgi:hypothetical protein
MLNGVWQAPRSGKTARISTTLDSAIASSYSNSLTETTVSRPNFLSSCAI